MPRERTESTKRDRPFSRWSIKNHEISDETDLMKWLVSIANEVAV
jgi:hypothetical protein